MVRQKDSLLALMSILLMTFLYLFNPLGVDAEEKLFTVNDGIFVNGELPDITSNIRGTYEASKNYKFISKYGSMYYYNYDVDYNAYSNTDDLDTAIEEANVYKKGDKIAICADMAGDSVYESYLESYKDYVLLVYSEDGTEKYSIKYTDLAKYVDGMTKKVEVSLNFVSNVTDSVGNVKAKKYKVSGGIPTSVTIGDSYFQNDTESSDFTFDFYGADGTYNYTVELTNGYTATGTLTQSGIYVGNDASNVTEDIPAADVEIKNPTLTLSKIPTKKCDSFKLTITSDIDAQICFNGEVRDEYKKEATFTVDANGVFYYSATTAEGGYTEGTVEVKCIKEPADEEETPWTDNDWGGQPSGKAGQNNLVQTGLFDNGINFSMYIGAVLVLLGAGILVAKKKGFSLKRGGTR